MNPLNDYIFLEYNQDKDQKKEGIILSDIGKEMPSIAKVFAIGDKVEKVRKDDQVIFNPFIVREVKVGKNKYYILKEKDIYGIID